MTTTYKDLCPRCRPEEDLEELPLEPEDSGETNRDSSGDVDGTGNADSSTQPPASNNDGTPQPGGKGVGNSHGRGVDPASKEELKKAAEQFLDEMRQNEDIRQEIQQMHSSIREQQGESTLPKASYYLQTLKPSAQSSALRRRFVEEMSLLSDKSDPGWDYRKDSGRVNVQRYAISQDPDIAFDLWREGAGDACDIEAVIALDVSGSMNMVAEATAEAMWIIKSGLDAIGASATVITYDGRAEVLYQANERANLTNYKYNFMGGGTNPDPALREACFILSESRRTSKILISITDGEWGGRSDEMIQALSEGGVHTAMLFYVDPEFAEHYGITGDPHGHKTFLKVTKPQDITQFARTLVTDIIRERL